MKRKVIICTDGIFPFSVGGMQRHSRFLIEYLSELPEMDEILVIHPHDKGIFNSPKIKEITVEPIDTSKNYLLECYRYSKRVFKIVIQFPDHIVYSQGLSIWYGASKIGNRLIVNPHGLEPFQSLTTKDWLISIPFRIIFKRIFRSANKIISLGGKLTDILNRTGNREKVVCVPNATEIKTGKLRDRFKESDEKVICFFLSRFASNKGIHILMQAINELNKEGYKEKFQFNLGGKGPLWNNYKESSLPPNVELLGFVEDDELFNYFNSSDLFVFPTLFEGMPTVILEAMASGLPVISTNVGAIAELVDDSNGFLINRNSVDQLKESLLLFLKFPSSMKQKMSLSSVEKFEKRFSWNQVAKNHFDLFQKLNF